MATTDVNGATPIRPSTPWTWKSKRREEEMSLAIAELFDPVVDRRLEEIARKALLAGVETSELPAGVRDAGPLWGVIRGATTGPDLLLVDDDHRVHVVVEHKRGAAAQASAMRGWRGREPFDDERARAVNKDLESVPLHTDELHLDTDCSEHCEDRWHTQRRAGMFRAGLWQIDAYRTYGRWLAEGWDLSPPLSVGSPEDVLWLVLDRNSRSAAQAFPGALTGDIWKSTGYAQFVPVLFEGYEEAVRLNEAARAAKLLDVLRMASS